MKRVLSVLLVVTMMLSVTMAQTNIGPVKISGGRPINNSNNVGLLDSINTWTLGNTFKNYNGNCSLAWYKTGSTTGGIAEAQADGCTSIEAPPGTYTITTSLTITTTGLTIFGYHDATVFVINHTGNFITQTAQNFTLANVQIKIGTTSSRASASLLTVNTQIAHFNNLHIVPNLTSADNGAVFSSTGQGTTAGAVVFNQVYVQAGGKWHNVVKITNLGANSITAASFIMHGLFGGAICVESCLYFDGFIDTFEMDGSQFDGTTGGTGPTVWVRNTIGDLNNPRWIHLTGFYAENGGNASGFPAIQLDAVRDFQYNGGYIASAQQGVLVGANTIGVSINHATFVNIGREGIQVVNGASNVVIDGNNFDDTANAANNTYDTISLGTTVAGGLVITNNIWRNASGVSKPRYGINIGASNNHYQIMGNQMTQATFGTNYINGQCLAGDATVLNAPNGFSCNLSTNGTFNLFSKMLIARGGIQSDVGDLTFTSSTSIVSMPIGKFTIGLRGASNTAGFVWRGNGTNYVESQLGTSDLLNAPRMTFTCQIASLNGVASYCTFVTEAPITLTRIFVQQITGSTGCATFPVISAFNGSGSAILSSVTESAASAIDSGAISVNVAAGINVSARVTTAGVTCSPTASNVSVTFQYKMQ